jgi:mannose-6-phosphate isomerase-like protein (cupin superfamily)
MEKVIIDDVPVERNPMQVHDVRKPVSRELGTEHFAANYFELDPGDSFSGALHRHHDQEEVFYIERGQTTFEVGRDREAVDVSGGELIRFEPGEFQEGYNSGEERVVGWAFGAPGATHDWDDLESRAHCPECDAETTQRVAIADGRFELTCTDCGNVQG